MKPPRPILLAARRFIQRVTTLARWTANGQLLLRYRERYPAGKDVTKAKLVKIKSPRPVGEMALFVTHVPSGVVKPHVPIYLRALRGQGIKVTVIIATDQDVICDELSNLVDGLYIRQNEGFDFAAWAHIMRDLEDLGDVTAIYLLNDSIIGPFNESSFGALVERIRASPADLVCLTDSHERVHHFQSYFIVVKGKAIGILEKFLRSVVSFPNKKVVIRRYELRLLNFFKARGVRSEAIFAARTSENGTMDNWRQLINRGSPFVKAAALRDYPAGRNQGWREVLTAHGFDPLVAEQTLAIIDGGEVTLGSVVQGLAPDNARPELSSGCSGHGHQKPQ